MTLLFYKALASFFIFLTSVVTIIYPLRRKMLANHAESWVLGESLASGIFLGAAFFHMLPDAIRLFNGVYGELAFPIPEAICVAGFLLMLFLERLSLIYNKVHAKNSIPYILAMILIIHALTEGAALGISESFSETSIILIAIIAHKGSESFALCITLLRHQLPLIRIIMIAAFFALMTPLGIGLGSFIQELNFSAHGQIMAGIFNAFAAGTFLYMSTLHHIHFHKHAEESQGMLELACLVVGLAAMGAIAWWV